MDIADPHPLRYLFIDFNSDFAAVEQNDDPSLVGRPVMVVPLASEHTGAIAVSVEAKRLGIRRGTSVRDACRIEPGITILPARHDRYVIVHNQLMAEIGRHVPVTRILSIDECACRLDDTQRAPERARALAGRIKRAIARNVGPSLRTSIGIAPSVLLVKLASDLEKPDGLVVIEAAMLPEVLLTLPLGAISGIGENMARRLARAGVTDFAGLWALAPKHARAIWGSVAGERFCYALHGHDILEDLPAQKRMIGHSRVLSREDQPLPKARIVARALLLKAASRLRLGGLFASRMTVGMRFRPDGWLLLRALDRAWTEMAPHLARVAPERAGRLALVTTHLSGLTSHPPVPDLFATPGTLERDRREALLWSHVDQLNRAYGKPVVQVASHHGLNLNYLGVKIAFSRVPDVLEFG